MASRKLTQFTKPNEDDKNETVTTVNKQSLSTAKKVVMEQSKVKQSTGSLSHISLYQRMQMELRRTLETRKQFQIHENVNNDMVDVTPKPIELEYQTEGYKKLIQKYTNLQMDEGAGDTESFKSINSSFMRARSSRGMGLRLSMEDIMNGIGSGHIMFDAEGNISTRQSLNIVDLDSSSSSLSYVEKPFERIHKLPFIRIILRKTELMLLYEQHSMTSIKNTVDGRLAEQDNKEYDYLTIGKGKIRRRSEAETQTFGTLYKSREISTMPMKKTDTGCYVSNFEMYDTFQNLTNKMNDESEDKAEKKLDISFSKTAQEQFAVISQLSSFHLASLIMKRVLAGNTFQEGQCKFRRMNTVNRLVDKIDYKYSIKTLFTINPASKDNIRKAVSDMSFCPANGDILAVSYGIYSYQAAKLPKTGEVCVWSIKNPCDPERLYPYNVPVISIEFSTYMPTLLAVGLYDGSVEVHDIALHNQPPLAISQRISSPGVSPVLAIKWIKQCYSPGHHDIDPFLTLSQDGSVTLFRLNNSPYLVGSKQIVLERIEGIPEGIPVKYSSDLSQITNRCPQGLNLTKHPVHPDIYYVLIDEGCIYKCSTNYQEHYLEVLKTHDGAVNCMDFSPWSPKLFLTCGNDWYIRIWMEGIFKPLITLKNLFGPYQWASWSHTHSTIVIAINRKQCEIWDLKRSILKPISTTLFEQSYNTMGIFSLDGYSILIGNERGNVFVNALEEMPFPPHYQYDSLEEAVFKAVSNYPNLMLELKTLGYFGYPNKGFVLPP